MYKPLRLHYILLPTEHLIFLQISAAYLIYLAYLLSYLFVTSAILSLMTRPSTARLLPPLSCLGTSSSRVIRYPVHLAYLLITLTSRHQRLLPPLSCSRVIRYPVYLAHLLITLTSRHQQGNCLSLV